MIQELVDAGAFGDKYGSVVADSNADVALLHTGKAGMLLQGAWVYGTFLTDAPDFVKGGKLGFANFPTVDGGKGDPKSIVGNPANFWSVSAAASPEAQDVGDQVPQRGDVQRRLHRHPDLIGCSPGHQRRRGQAQGLRPGRRSSATPTSMVKDAPSFQLSWDQALTAAPAQALLTNLSQVFLRTADS